MTNIDFTKKRERKIPQNFVTILSKIKGPRGARSEQEDRVRSAISGLGNPATKSLNDRLKQFSHLHFMSMHVVKGADEFEPSYVLLEMSIDGHDSDAIGKLCKYIGDELFEIYQLAGRVKSRSHLCAALIEDNVKIKQSLWPEFYGGNNGNGLEFSGTAGLEASDIHQDSRIAEYARHIIEHEVHEHSQDTYDQASALDAHSSSDLTPHKIFEHVQYRINTEAEDDAVRDAWAQAKSYSVTPNYAEDSTAVWKTHWNILTLAKNLIPTAIVLHVAWIYLAIASLVWLGLFNIPGDVDVVLPGEAKASIYHSPKFVLFGIAWSAVIAAGIDTLLMRFKRPGAVIWFTLAFLIYFSFPNTFSLLTDFEEIRLALKSLPGKLMAFDASSALDPFAGLFSKIGLNGAGTMTQLAVLGGGLMFLLAALRMLNKRLPGLGYFAVALAILMGLIRSVWQYLGPIKTGDIKVLNPWDFAGLPELIFFPFGLALVLMIAAYSAIAHAPMIIKSMTYTPIDRLVVILENNQIRAPWLAKISSFIKSNAIYAVIFTVTFVFILKNAFFPPSVDTTSDINTGSLLMRVVVIPLALVVAVIFLYFATNKTLGRKNGATDTRSFMGRFGKPAFALWALFAIWVNGKTIFTPKGLEFISSFMLAIPLTMIILVTLFGIMWFFIRRSEVNNIAEDFNPDEAAVSNMLLMENKNLSQNHMISVQRILPETFRKRFTMPVAFTLLLEVVKKQRFRPGFLANMGTVHYARWIHLPNTNNYIFLSNYDGSWESYLEDFVTKANEGLNAAWSHCVGYPKMRGVFFEGSEDGDRFKRWARRSMQPTPFWYSAYPQLSAEEIRRNALIRDGLATKDLSPSDAAAWLDLFSSIPRPENQLQSAKIQSLVFGGMGALKHGACIAVKLADPLRLDRPALLSDWIDDILPQVNFDDKSPMEQAAYIALSAEGLSILGMDDVLGKPAGDERSPVTQFPSAFTMGMDHPGRQAVLNDMGRNAPSEWEWGKKDDHIVAALLVYGHDTQALDAKIAAMTNKIRHRESNLATAFRSLDDYHLVIASKTIFSPLKDDKKKGEFDAEPFGFADGISQPIIEGARNARKAAGSIHLVKPGEFVLGYKDNRDYFPPSPQINADRDGCNFLPAIPRHLPQRYPKFDVPKVRPPRDFGRNGSFLVIRQLEQNVDIFNQNKAEAAAHMMGLRMFTPDIVADLGLPEDLTHKSVNDLDNQDLFLMATSLQPNLTKENPTLSPRLLGAADVTNLKSVVAEAMRERRVAQLAKQMGVSPRAAKKEFEERKQRWLEAIPELMVGRKTDGTSLMHCPYKIIKQPGEPVDIEHGQKSRSYDIIEDNEFLFGRDDPQGYRCPYGSHVRRSNPRDGLDIENDESLAITNRHRILRRGRAYGRDSGTQGTFFICLNADIERQFEFVQQSWIDSPKFHGMRDEVDPIVGQGIHPDYNIPENDMKFTVQAPLGDLRIGGLSSYVTMRGGGYFFLPSLDSLKFLASQPGQ